MAAENRNGAVDLDFGDGPHRFRLAIGELEELQEKTGIGPFLLLNRLIGGDWRLADVREALRLGLIGGGMEPIPALNLVRRYVDERPAWLANAALARLVLMAALSGAPEEVPGKGAGRGSGTRRRNSRTGASPSAAITGQPQPSAAPPASSDT